MSSPVHQGKIVKQMQMKMFTVTLDPDIWTGMVNYHERNGKFTRKANDEVTHLLDAEIFKGYQLLSKASRQSSVDAIEALWGPNCPEI